MEILIILSTVGMLISLYSYLSEENGFILSTKKIGFVMMFAFAMVYFIAIFETYSEKRELVKICVENNVTIPKRYQNIVVSIKVGKYVESLKD